MKKRCIIFACAALFGVSLLVPAVAQQRSGWLQRKRANLIVQHIVSDLGLSDIQRSQIKTILQNEQPKIQSLLKATEQTNELLRSKTSFDESFVRSVAQNQAATLTESIVEREKIRAEIMAVLTPDQQQKFNQMANQFRSAVHDRLSSLGDDL